MHRLIAPAFVAAILAVSSPSHAQDQVCACGAVHYASATASATSAGYSAGSTGMDGSNALRPYSYFASRGQLPARTYVPYGSGDNFTFTGRPYGHPSDAWSWSYIGGGYQNAMARYYYPPVR